MSTKNPENSRRAGVFCHLGLGAFTNVSRSVCFSALIFRFSASGLLFFGPRSSVFRHPVLRFSAPDLMHPLICVSFFRIGPCVFVFSSFSNFKCLRREKIRIISWYSTPARGSVNCSDPPHCECALISGFFPSLNSHRRIHLPPLARLLDNFVRFRS